jgi:pyridoxamine 5'-phosphate oxidase
MSKIFSKELASNPIQQFRLWYKQAAGRMDLPEAMCLSTLNARGAPSGRMVLLKDVSLAGFSFFTNIESSKAEDLRRRPQAALTFYWRPLRRQVRIEGKAVRLPKRVADAYFASRPRDSQIGSWASLQSRPLATREHLLARFQQFADLFKSRKIPAPPHWQGFLIQPARMEFWQEQPNRLHDRWLYTKGQSGRWGMMRLYP